jgi:hypothetical protein
LEAGAGSTPSSKKLSGAAPTTDKAQLKKDGIAKKTKKAKKPEDANEKTKKAKKPEDANDTCGCLIF